MSNITKICQHRTVTLNLLRMWDSHREQLVTVTTCTFEVTEKQFFTEVKK